MSHWDPERQCWVDDDPRAPGHAPPYDPDGEQRVTLGPPPEDGIPTGPSHASILAGALAGVILAGGLGLGLWAALRDDDGGGGGPDAPPGASSSMGALPSPTGTDGLTGGWPFSRSDEPTDGPAGEPTTTAPGFPGYPTAVPTGGSSAGRYVRTTDPAGYSLAVPVGWTRSTQNASVFYTSPSGTSLIQIWELDGPESTPYDAMVATEKTVSGNKGYHLLQLARGGTSDGAAELEYAYTRSDGSDRHVLVHAYTAPDHHQYALLVAGPSDAWSSHLEIARTLTSTFCPTGYCSQ
ncbi:hypothetical protein AB0K09_24895 [Streptomyces sp. NPDC049577]|uniref:hypothetical protein n=1 Tax=Streptomyces sp. NPDC049577 TaxID=3155153 RepID=UPI003421C01C